MICLQAVFLGPPAQAQDGDEIRQFQYAEKLFKDGMYELAAMQYQAFLDRYAGSPRGAEALYKLGETQFQAGRYQAARSAFLELLIEHAATDFAPLAQFRSAESFEREGRFEEASAAYYRLNVYYPEHKRAVEALWRAADTRQRAEGFKAAEPWLRQLILNHAESREAGLAILALAKGLTANGGRREALGLYQRLVDHPIGDSDKWDALSLMAPLLVFEGEWSRAETVYGTLASQGPADKYRHAGQLGLARITASQGRFDAARTAFETALNLPGGASSDVYAALGRMETNAGETARAVVAYKKALAAGSPTRFPSAILEAAAYLIQQRETAGIDPACEALRADTAATVAVRTRALLILAALSRDQQRYGEAVTHYQTFIDSQAMHPLYVHVVLAQAAVLIDHLGGTEAGLSKLRGLMASHPTTPLIDEVHFQYAAGAAAAGLSSEARRHYQWVLEFTPWSARAAASRIALNHLGRADRPDWMDVMLSWSETGVGEDAAERQFNLGKRLVTEYRQPLAARRFLSHAIKKTTDASWHDEAALLLAQSYAYDEAGAMDAYREAASSMDDGPMRDLALGAVALLQDSVAAAPLVYLANVVQQADLADRLRLKLAKLWITDAQTARADSVLSEISPNSDELIAEEAMVLRITALHADSLAGVYLSQFPKGVFWPEMRYRLAMKIEDEQGWRDLIKKAPQTVWAQRARLALGQYFNRKDRFPEAESIFREALSLIALQQDAVAAGLQHHSAIESSKYQQGLAESLLGQKKTGEARRLLEEALLSEACADVQHWSWRMLAALSEAQGELERAAWYLEQIAEAAPSDTTLTTWAQFHFRHQQYGEALSVYERMVREKWGDPAEASAWSVTCLLRQGRISQGNTRFTQFKQLYRRHPQYKLYDARYALERGMALASAKRFDAAVEALKTAVKSKQADVVPEAEVELGKTYLIMAHVDEALKILTEMPRKYAGHAVLDRVYFYLGEHYFNSKQYENATLAYRWVVDNGQTPHLRPAALRLLVRCYETIGRPDGAMAMVREFIREYPNDPDRLNLEVKIGSLYMALAEYGRAVEIFRRLRPLAGADAEAEIQFKIGQSLALSGRWEEAVFEYLKVSYLSRETKLPWKTTAIFEAGRAFIKLDQLDRARSMFELVIRRDGANGMFGKVAQREIESLEALMPKENGGRG